MMKYICLSLLVFLSLSLAGQAITYVHNDRTHLLGPIEIDDLKKDPFASWFDKVYTNYNPDVNVIERLNQYYDDDISVKVYLGTWCGDSKREVTKFLKLVDSSKIESDHVELICLDNRGDKLKRGPNGEEQGRNIHRVPTFIFYKEGEEIGRIVERPNTTLESDVAQIYAGLPSKAQYEVANYLLEQLSEVDDYATIDSSFVKYTRYYKRMVTSESELNTLGYLLIAADQLEEAELVFRCNTLLFPESSNVYDSLGEAQMIACKYQESVGNYITSLLLDPSNENARKQIATIVSKVDISTTNKIN